MDSSSASIKRSAEGCARRRKGLGQVTTLPAVRVPGGAPSIYGVLSLRATLRTSSEGPLRPSARDLGNFEEEQREHRLTCAGYARAYGEDDRDRAGERDGGPKQTEALVRQGSQGVSISARRRGARTFANDGE